MTPPSYASRSHQSFHLSTFSMLNPKTTVLNSDLFCWGLASASGSPLSQRTDHPQTFQRAF